MRSKLQVVIQAAFILAMSSFMSVSAVQADSKDNQRIILPADGAGHLESLNAASDPLQSLEHRVDQLESSYQRYSRPGGAFLFLCGVISALWAQNTGRSGLAWFFLGLLFNVFTLLVILVMNPNEIRRHNPIGP